MRQAAEVSELIAGYCYTFHLVHLTGNVYLRIPAKCAILVGSAFFFSGSSFLSASLASYAAFFTLCQLLLKYLA
jgi:hypothetical protein